MIFNNKNAGRKHVINNIAQKTLNLFTSMIYVALLRGINVGGNNKVDMKKLKTTFESLGFNNVVTYINSGNIVFAESSKDQSVIVSEIEMVFTSAIPTRPTRIT